ncbi:hypothetical protein [Pantoea sp. B65]|uniref:hypothetical protein n=1 Tax=Pantoea sp. B65 TaxID=2813359 RepID=UPI0039B6A6FF
MSITGVTNGIYDGIPRDPAATPAAHPAISATEPLEKDQSSAVVAISPEAVNRLKQTSSETEKPPLSEEQQQENSRKINELKLVSPPVIPATSADFYNDVLSPDDAVGVSSLLGLARDSTQSSLDKFTAALHKVLSEGTAAANLYDNSDISKAMAISLTEAKLHKLVDKYIDSGSRDLANTIVDTLIGHQVASREQSSLQLAQAALTVAGKSGDGKQIADVKAYISRLEQDNSHQQQQLAAMQNVTQHGDNMDEAFATFSAMIDTQTEATTQNINGMRKQLEAYKAQWQAFIKSLI